MVCLPTNIRQGWEGLQGTNTSFLQTSVHYGSKKFFETGPRRRLKLLGLLQSGSRQMSMDKTAS
jgi:hypothetical protein